MTEVTNHKALAIRAGWILHPKFHKWYLPNDPDSAMYRDTPRAFRYICEDYHLV